VHAATGYAKTTGIVPSIDIDSLSPRVLKFQVSIHSKLLTIASQRRYNQPNIATGVAAAYDNKISLVLHEKSCGVAASSDKTDG